MLTFYWIESIRLIFQKFLDQIIIKDLISSWLKRHLVKYVQILMKLRNRKVFSKSHLSKSLKVLSMLQMSWWQEMYVNFSHLEILMLCVFLVQQEVNIVANWHRNLILLIYLFIDTVESSVHMASAKRLKQYKRRFI